MADSASFAIDELDHPAPLAVSSRRRPVALVRIGDDVYAIGDTCSHADVSLSEGEVWCDEREIECRKHGSTFSLTPVNRSRSPATQPVPVYEAGWSTARPVTAEVGGIDEHALRSAACTPGSAARRSCAAST